MGATETRRSLGLSESEPIDIFRALRYVEGINIVRCPFGDSSNMSGLFVKKREVRLIVINTERSWGHQLFTAAHEFYHMKYNEGMSGSLCHAATFSDRLPEEYDADKFAANLLVPTSGLEYVIEKEFGDTKLGFPEIIYLEQYFMVSHKAMLWRLQEIGKLTNRERMQLSDGIKSKARELGYDTRLYEKTRDYEIMSGLSRKVREALERELISEGKAQEFLLSFGYDDWEEGGFAGNNDENMDE